MWKGQGSFECAGFNAGAVGMRDRIYILGGDYSPDEITDEVQVGKKLPILSLRAESGRLLMCQCAY